MLPITHLTVHCAATPEGKDFSADTVASWDMQRFGQESYHHIVTLDGVDHVRLADNVRGAHVAGANSGNIGVCYVGGLDANQHPKDTRTDAQRATLRAIVAAYRAKYPGIVVLGHRDWPRVLKACPCFDVKTEL
jgi:N-acetyl-anhydromuramyl-L-alanine amidase AmpD